MEANSTQLRKGTLELCILAVLGEEEEYGYQIVKKLNEAGELEVSEGTVYPILARLKNDGYIVAQWKEPATGAARKYYRLSNLGRQMLEHQTGEWIRLRKTVDRLLTRCGEKK